MKSRFFVGVATLAAVMLAIGGAAGAQRMGRFQQMMQRAEQSRSTAPADPNMSPLTASGNYRFSFVHDGITREYLVHVPKSYRGAATPMLVALHGGGGNADFQADDSKYKLVSKSDSAGFIAVFPNGYSRFPSGILATWNAGTCCGAAQKNAVDDVGFIREVIARVERQARIDPRRIFATGMSNGAMMSWRLACEAPEIRAIAPVEGTDNTTRCKPARPVAVIEFHATDDPNCRSMAVSALDRRTPITPRSRRRRRNGSTSTAPIPLRNGCSRFRVRIATFTLPGRAGRPLNYA